MSEQEYLVEDKGGVSEVQPSLEDGWLADAFIESIAMEHGFTVGFSSGSVEPVEPTTTHKSLAELNNNPGCLRLLYFWKK